MPTRELLRQAKLVIDTARNGYTDYAWHQAAALASIQLQAALAETPAECPLRTEDERPNPWRARCGELFDSYDEMVAHERKHEARS